MARRKQNRGGFYIQFAGRKGERIQRPGVRERYGYLAPHAKAAGANRSPYTPI